jgi:hypothetical protein
VRIAPATSAFFQFGISRSHWPKDRLDVEFAVEEDMWRARKSVAGATVASPRANRK